MLRWGDYSKASDKCSYREKKKRMERQIREGGMYPWSRG